MGRNRKCALAGKNSLFVSNWTSIPGYIGSFEFFGDIPRFLHLARTVGTAHPQVVFFLVGEGDLGDELRRQAEAGGLAKRFIFPGRVSHDRVPALLSVMDLVISPYKDDYLFYGSSMKLLEYMASGKAVLFPALGQIKELIADGYNGSLHEPGDYPAMNGKLLELIDNDQWRQQLGGNARRTIERGWTWDHQAARIARVLELAVAGRRWERSNMAKICLFLLMISLGLPSPVGLTAASAQEAKIMVNAAQTCGAVSPLLFGQNVLFAGNSLWNARIDGLDPAVKPLIEGLAPTLLRFPGGSAADQYLWEDGLGFLTLEAVTPTSTAAMLDGDPQWVGVVKALLIDSKGGQFGEPFSFLRLNGNRLEGILGIKGLHPAGVSVRLEVRPGQPDWFSNSYGIAEHLRLVKALGGEAILTINYSTGLDRDGKLSTQASLSQRVKRAAALVAYVNGDLNNATPMGTDEEGRNWQTVSYWAQKRAAQGQREPFRVRYWEVGNEVCEKTEIGYTMAQKYARDFPIFAQAMKKVAPGIQIGAVGLSDPKGRGDADANDTWNPTVVKLAGGSIDFLVIHPYYPSAGPPKVSYQSADWFAAILAGASRALADLKEIRAVVNANAPAGKNIGLAVTEYGIWPYASKDPRDYSNLAGALYDADLLMGLSREAGPLGLIGAAAWNLHGSNPTAAIGFNWDLGTRTVRPQYHALKMLRKLSGLKLLDTQVVSPTFTVPAVGNVKGTPPVSSLGAIAATTSDRRRLSLLVINRSLTTPVTADIQLQEFAPQPAALVLTLSADQAGDHNEVRSTTVAPTRGNLTTGASQMTFTFGAHSLTRLEFQAQSQN